MRRLRDPFVGSMLVLAVLAAAGLLAVALAWESLADSMVVAIQLPYLVSGGIGGLALSGFALGLIAIQTSRRVEAQERAELGRVTDAAATLLADVRSRRAR